ncbi:SPRY domain-containing SOCS box protein 3 isoform X1 [Anopheles cruzii]|uniref:SPRY domain-containing SOCS box protein 3 isoform X1 n=2 Tax=Anopheles cruzii TaxID=68878 RepID=UPI0022EC7341|nr:SPRY domain-containing SOCS box protein 3 isoform X1 [Anopheles cruzii]
MRHFAQVPTEMSHGTKTRSGSEFTSNNEHYSKPFCHCEYPLGKRFSMFSKEVKQCNCGEDTSTRIDWMWETVPHDPRSDVPNPPYMKGTEVLFHPIYSQGTSVVRSNEPLTRGQHHYWELKILSPLSGTDIMIGIGTDKVDLLQHCFTFASVLGQDDQSWGYSYRGLAQHNGHFKYYGSKYSQGRIIGVYVDMFRGTLEYFLNRRTLGCAYAGIPTSKDVQIYPMISCTSSKTSMKLINAASFEDSLRFQCMKVICKYPKLLDQVKAIPGLQHMVQELWFLQFKGPADDPARNNSPLADEAVLCGKKLKLDSDAQRYENTEFVTVL